MKPRTPSPMGTDIPQRQKMPNKIKITKEIMPNNLAKGSIFINQVSFHFQRKEP